MNQSKINGTEEVSRASEKVGDVMQLNDEQRGWRLAGWDEQE